MESFITKLKDRLALIIAVLASTGLILQWLGARVETTSERLERHEMRTAVLHDTLSAEIKHLHERDAEVLRLQRAQIIGECLENTRDQLALQDLLTTCQAYGIQR